jgi:hypothetical protein
MVRGWLVTVILVCHFDDLDDLSAMWSVIPNVPFLNADRWLNPTDP